MTEKSELKLQHGSPRFLAESATNIQQLLSVNDYVLDKGEIGA